jgi:hypothetical protein
VNYVEQRYGVSYGVIFKLRYPYVSYAFLRSSNVENMREQKQLGGFGVGQNNKERNKKSQKKAKIKKKESKPHREFGSTRAIGAGR